MIIFVVATRYVKYWWLTMKDYMGGHFNHAFKVNLEKSRLSFITEYVLSLSWYRVNHIMLERCLCLIFIYSTFPVCMYSIFIKYACLIFLHLATNIAIYNMNKTEYVFDYCWINHGSFLYHNFSTFYGLRVDMNKV